MNLERTLILWNFPEYPLYYPSYLSLQCLPTGLYGWIQSCCCLIHTHTHTHTSWRCIFQRIWAQKESLSKEIKISCLRVREVKCFYVLFEFYNYVYDDYALIHTTKKVEKSQGEGVSLTLKIWKSVKRKIGIPKLHRGADSWFGESREAWKLVGGFEMTAFWQERSPILRTWQEDTSTPETPGNSSSTAVGNLP